MANFTYRARDKQNRILRGTIEAQTEDEAITSLLKDNYIILHIKETKRERLARRLKRLHSRVKLDDLVIFANQLSILLEAGVNLLRGLDIISEQVESIKLRKALIQIKKDVEAGSSLRDALAKFPDIFSDFWLGLVETGEASGQLPSTLTQLARYLEFKARFQGRVLNSMIYPAILVTFAILAFLFFLLKIVPTFERIFSSFGGDLPVLTKFLILFSVKVRQNLFLGFLFVVFAGFLCYRYIQTEDGKWRFDNFKLGLPVVGPLFLKVAIARFARGLGILLRSGTPILIALDIVTKGIGNKVVELELDMVKANVQRGRGMAEPLAGSEVFPPMVSGMVEIGEESGKLGEILDKVADYFEEQVDIIVTRLTSLIEPFLLIALAVSIGIMLIAMFLPIFSIARLGL